MRVLATWFLAAFGVATSAAQATAQGSHLMTLLGRVNHSPCTTGDVWALNERYMLIARRSAGFAVVDAADPRNPISANIVPPGYPTSGCNYGVGDIKSDGRYIYATSEGGNGVFIYDSQPNPMSPTLVTHLQHTRVSGGVHNCWIDGNVLYCVSNRTGYIEVFDVSNHAAPQWLSSLGTGSGAHDVIALDGRAYCSLWADGFAIYDMRVPSVPVLLVRHGYPEAHCHNCWPSSDRRYLYTTDETVLASGEGGFVRIWDLGNLQNITEVGSYKAGARESVIHNVHVRGDYLFVSYYKEGVRVCSIHNPTQPVEIAYYDTYPSTAGGCFAGCFGSFGYPYAGCWGVYPFTTTKLFVSDLDTGGYILSLEAVGHSLSATAGTVPRGGTIELSFSYTNNTVAALGGVGLVILTDVGGVPVFVPMWADATNLAAMQTRSAPPIRIPLPLALPPMNVEFRGYGGIINPTMVAEPTVVPITIQ